MRRGSAEIGDQLVNPQDVALLKMDGSSTIEIKIQQKNTSILIMGGEPIDEPIANRGPFVMNTQDELRQAMVDYSSGKMGR
jgi:redox-sensitive bicupin YhaK (pirin superfamily)